MSAKKAAKKSARKAPAKKQTKQAAAGKGIAAANRNEASPSTLEEPPANAIDSQVAAEESAVEDGTADPQVSGTSPGHSNKPAAAAKAPDRKEVIQLATQLMSAQIAAHSHHETAMGLFNEFRQMALDVAVLLRPRTVTTTILGPQHLEPTGPVPDKAINTNEAASDSTETQAAPEMSEGSANPNISLGIDAILRVGDSIMHKQRLSLMRARKPRSLQPMSHPDLDRLFQSAMRRAFVMLNAPFDPERVVFAEQIFSPSERLAEGAIRQRFIDFKWPDLSSGTSVIRLMKDVNRWYTQELTDLSTSRQSVEGKESISAMDPSIPIRTRIEAEAEKLSWLLNQASGSDALSPETDSSYRSLESALSKFTSTRNGTDIAGAFRSLDAGYRQNLIFAMFGGKGPRDADAQTIDNFSEDADKESSKSRITYRPWAIFRYLRRHGRKDEDELGRDIYNRLRANRAKLAPKRVPDIPGIEPAEFEFGPLHQDVDDLLDELAYNEGGSDCSANSDALDIHGLDPDDVAMAATEFGLTDRQSDDEIPHF